MNKKILDMDEKQLSQTAQLMFLQNSRRKDVIDFLAANNVVGDAAETMATEAYLAIKDQRQAMLKTKEEQVEKGGVGSIILGAILMIGGISASMNSDTLWYGAILGGFIIIIKGLAARA